MINDKKIKIVKKWKTKFGQDHINILIATYNRLEYLKKTVWSIIASEYHCKTIEFRILILNDQSDDGTNEWLKDMTERNLIYKVISLPDKVGTANAYNILHGNVDYKDEWFVITNDDMWYHSMWFPYAAETMLLFKDCGIVNMYDYTALNVEGNSVVIDKSHLKVKTTGLGSVVMNNKLYSAVGGFSLPSTQYMGFFASSFCKQAYNTSLIRKFIYQLVPNQVANMDRKSSKLKEMFNEYVEYRKRQKK